MPKTQHPKDHFRMCGPSEWIGDAMFCKHPPVCDHCSC